MIKEELDHAVHANTLKLIELLTVHNAKADQIIALHKQVLAKLSEKAPAEAAVAIVPKVGAN